MKNQEGAFDGKIVAITGGGSGIGRATAEKFLKNNATVYLLDISEENLKNTARDIEKKGGKLCTMQLDVTDFDRCGKVLKEIYHKEGKLDVLINSAGVSIIAPVEEMTEKDWHLMIDVNLKGTFSMCRHAIPYLEETKGAIVNLSSCSGIMGGSHEVIYSASKGGIILLTKALAVELACKGIKVNTVAPGDTDTNMFEEAVRLQGDGDRAAFTEELLSAYPAGAAGRLARPEEIADTIYFLASPEIGIMTGAVVSVDGGFAAGY